MQLDAPCPIFQTANVTVTPATVTFPGKRFSVSQISSMEDWKETHQRYPLKRSILHALSVVGLIFGSILSIAAVMVLREGINIPALIMLPLSVAALSLSIWVFAVIKPEAYAHYHLKVVMVSGEQFQFSTNNADEMRQTIASIEHVLGGRR